MRSEGWRQRVSVTLARAVSWVIRLRAENSFSEAFLASGHTEAGPQPDWQGRLADLAPDRAVAAEVDMVTVGHVHVGQPAVGDVQIGLNTTVGTPSS